MKHYMDFSSDKVDVFLLLVDSSNSMEDEADDVSRGLKMYKRSFENFPEVGSIAVSVSKFASDLYLAPFVRIEDINTSYSTDGATVLHYAIVEGAQYLKKYINEITEKKGIVPRATFIVFSDGQPCQDPVSYKDAQKVISDLNFSGVTTVFVAFGEGIKSDYGKSMGFMSTIDVNDRNVLVDFLGVELSKSCKEQSKSLKALGENFFSKAVGDKTTEYSATTSQALEDEDWMNDI